MPAGYQGQQDRCDRAEISEEEYHHIIAQYATIPIELDWHPLEFEQTDNNGKKPGELNRDLYGEIADV